MNDELLVDEDKKLKDSDFITVNVNILAERLHNNIKNIKNDKLNFITGNCDIIFTMPSELTKLIDGK